jgi:transcriptional regulator with XRE-family HTH domain
LPHPIDIHVGQRLRLRRTILGMSQEAIGTAIGVSFQQIQKYERGVNRMGASRLFEFSKLLEIPVSYFFDEYAQAGGAGDAGLGMAESDTPAFEHENPIASRETMEMMRAYYQIPSKNVRKRVFDLIKSLAAEQKD